jgi:hypothetical protein
MLDTQNYFVNLNNFPIPTRNIWRESAPNCHAREWPQKKLPGRQCIQVWKIILPIKRLLNVLASGF